MIFLFLNLRQRKTPKKTPQTLEKPTKNPITQKLLTYFLDFWGFFANPVRGWTLDVDGNVVWFVDGRGWGIWCGSWMGVDGEWRLDVLVESRMEERRVGRIENGGNLK